MLMFPCVLSLITANTRSLMRTFKKGSKSGASVMAKHSPQRFQWFCDNHPYGCSFPRGSLPNTMSRKKLIHLFRNYPVGGEPELAKVALWQKLRQAEPDVDDKDDLSRDELNEIVDKWARQRRPFFGELNEIVDKWGTGDDLRQRDT